MTGPVVYCDCACHKSPDLKWNPVGVDMRDTVAAESACRTCQPHHRFAQLGDVSNPFEPPRPFTPEPPRPADACGDSTQDEDDGN